MSATDVQLAVLAWEAALRRLAGPEADDAVWQVVDAVEGELRRRVGSTFTLGDLTRAYAGSSDWFLPLAADVAPRAPHAWSPRISLDGAFGRFGRQAADWGAV